MKRIVKIERDKISRGMQTEIKPHAQKNVAQNFICILRKELLLKNETKV